jgi:ribosomal-protein-alanine N-acetyltransferase
MIRDATIEDLAEIMIINNELPVDRWSEEKFLDVFNYDLNMSVICDDGLQIVGYIVSMVCLDETRVLNLTIKRSHRGNGFGNKLLNHVIIEAIDVFNTSYALLEIDVNNFPALQLYINTGFRVLCVRKDYYTDQVLRDAYLMQLAFSEYTKTNS